MLQVVINCKLYEAKISECETFFTLVDDISKEEFDYFINWYRLSIQNKSDQDTIDYKSKFRSGFFYNCRPVIMLDDTIKVHFDYYRQFN